jgi:hypothetical protein
VESLEMLAHHMAVHMMRAGTRPLISSATILFGAPIPFDKVWNIVVIIGPGPSSGNYTLAKIHFNVP